jgi:hypothetical protein
VGVGEIQDLARLNQLIIPNVSSIFLIDQMKRDLASPFLQATVTDERVDGHVKKVLEVRIKTQPNSLLTRYWIDLNKMGHVDRLESYSSESRLSTRLDIELAEFELEKGTVWMPIAGASVGYGSIVDKRPVTMLEPTSRASIRVLKGTLEFNKNPGPEVFTIKYRLGTPISDEVRKMQYAFGQQKMPSEPTKAKVEEMLKKAVALPEAQREELVAAPTEGIDWLRWLPWGFGSALVVALVAWQVQRRSH